MTDAYQGRDSKRSNAPAGHFRVEHVRLSHANRITLSGSPIQYFTDAAYRPAGGIVTGTYKMGVEGFYNWDNATVSNWKSPNTYLDYVDTDGYTIYLDDDGTHFGVGDLVSVYYYATGYSWRDSESPSQVGDFLGVETWDALTQKFNHAPSLAFKSNTPAMVFEAEMAYHNQIPANNATTTVIDAFGTGTWQTADTPFYPTAIFCAYTGHTIVSDLDKEASILVRFDAGGSEITYNISDLQQFTDPANSPAVGQDYAFFLNMGMVKCTGLRIRIKLDDVYGFTAWDTYVTGWCVYTP